MKTERRENQPRKQLFFFLNACPGVKFEYKRQKQSCRSCFFLSILCKTPQDYLKDYWVCLSSTRTAVGVDTDVGLGWEGGGGEHPCQLTRVKHPSCHVHVTEAKNIGLPKGGFGPSHDIVVRFEHPTLSIEATRRSILSGGIIYLRWPHRRGFKPSTPTYYRAVAPQAS